MNSLEKLAITQFQLVGKIREWKSKSGECLEKCEIQKSSMDVEVFQRYVTKGFVNHIQAARHDFLTQKPEYLDGMDSFEEILHNNFSCPHCLEWHRIQRKEILPLKRQLASVRGAITRIGKRLSAA